MEHDDTVIAACYVKWDSEEDLVREFGGICLDDRYRDRGIASILGRLVDFSACFAIAEQLRVWDLKVGDSQAFIDFGEHSGKSREILVDLAAELDLMARERIGS